MSVIDPEELCALCEQPAVRRESHIWPKFAVQWIKDNSMSTYLRTAGQPNKRKQDGLKPKLLGDCCEGLFSRWETEFAERVFRPANQTHRLECTYGTWFVKFAISLAWRTSHEWRPILIQEAPEFLESVDLAREHWKGYLLGKHHQLRPYEHHVFRFGQISKKPADGPQKLHSYMLHGLDLSFVRWNGRLYAYTLLPGFAFVSSIHPPKMRGWHNTQILPKGAFKGSQRVDDGSFGAFIQETVRLLDKIQISERQQEKVKQEIQRVARSEQNLSSLVKRAEALIADGSGATRVIVDELRKRDDS